MTITFYEYDHNRVYTGKSIVPAPRDVIPKNWTHIEPPTSKGFHIFDGSKWFTRDEYPKVHLPEVVVNRHITQLAYLERFTDEEAITIDLASIGNTVGAAMLRRMMAKVQAATYIDLDSQQSIDGINALVTMGILTQERCDEILYAPVSEEERPS